MKCIFCGCMDSKVIDSRTSADGNSIRRRRECLDCGKRFTTYEVVETSDVFVIKNGGIRQSFNVNKLKTGIIKACEKRPVPMYKIDELVANIQKNVYNSLEREISSKDLGEMVMEGLKNIDEVAYVRFASVYRQFKDITQFSEILTELESKLKK